MQEPQEMHDNNSCEFNIFERTEDFTENPLLNMPFTNEQVIDPAIINNFGVDGFNIENDENLYEEVSQKDIYMNKTINTKKDLIQSDNLSNKITNPLTSMNQKKPMFNLEVNSRKNSVKFESLKLIGKKRGRKIKEFHFDHTSSKHNKKSPDNIMRKLKTHFLDFAIKILNRSLSNKKYKFYKINKNVAENLKIDYNIILMERYIYDIFMNEKLSDKYTKNKNNNYNFLLIKTIFDQKIEAETIRLLNMKYIEFIREIIEKYFDEFINIIKKKERRNLIKKNEEEEYFNSLEKMLLSYEDYFKSKTGRNRGKNKMINE